MSLDCCEPGDPGDEGKIPTLLVIDDDPRVLRTLRRLLASEGYAVLTACDGRSGLSLADPQADLVLLDLMLPDIGGLDVCRRLRAEGYSRPIIAVTARAEDEDRRLGREAGFTDYVSKPFDPCDLLDRVRGHLKAAG